jgi:putative PEP-CTERM system integral membrane protein
MKNSSSIEPRKPVKALELLFNICFCIFNLTLLLIAYVGLLPFLGTALIADAFAGQVPLNFFIPFVGLVGVPTTCSVISVRPKQRRGISLFQLFYGVEAPLLVLCAVRFFWLRDLTPGTTLLLLTALAGIATSIHRLLYGRKTALSADEQPPTQVTPLWVSGLHLVGLSLLLLLALYTTAILAFYLPPFLVMVIPALPVVSVYALILLPITILLVGLFTAPIGVVWVCGRAWWQAWQSLSRRGVWSTALTVGTVAGWLVLFFALHQSPQLGAFELLASPAATPQARQELLQKQDLIRRGLVNAYLAPYRYPHYNDRHILDLYRYSLRLPESVAESVQSTYDVLLSPFTYAGDPNTDAEKASALYSQFFDTPILRGEKAAIEQAIESTFDRNGAKAGLDDINARRVWLAEQQLTVTPQGDWADVELHEVYDNQTYDQQEILYYFSLPESAVMTGLWLGDTADRSKSFPFVVSTRGAAQQVYNQEVNRRQDPALLEQVGPRQYRLRAFPIPPLGQGKMHLWMTYKVLQQDGAWAMPELYEQRNIFWTHQTQRTVNGQSVKAVDQWFPKAPAAPKTQPVAHQMSLDWGGHLLAQPFAASDYRLPQGQRFAIVVDGSYSMNAHQSQLKDTLRWLQNQVLPQNSADLYLTTAAPATPERIDNWKQANLNPVFYGTLQPSVILQQFLQLRGDTNYDAVILLTDSGSYELATDRPTALSMSSPLWLVHLGGLQFAYDDATLQAIQDSGGGVSTEVQEVMQRIGTTPTLGNGTTRLNVIDGYGWYLTKTPTASVEVSEGFEPIAARQWVTHLSRYVKPDQLQELDTIHAVTKEYGIVSPYSSMLVLVNDEQRQALKQAEQAKDRFNREIEDQALPQPVDALAVTATPEPSEWLLLLAVLCLIGWSYQRQKQTSAIGE